MALVSLNSLLEDALENKYAVGYFESWNLESVLAVVDAAEKMKSPIIIGFNGAFLGNEERKVSENIYHYGQLGRVIAEEAEVPVGLILNEADQVPLLVRGLKAGFNTIMYDNEDISFEKFIEINKYLVKTAHYCGAAVEAEVGELPSSDKATDSVSSGALTDPEQALRFVEETGIDALSVAVGNVHLLEGDKAELNLDLIKELRKKIPVPLVLHGGTGIDHDSLRQAIELGISKVNVGTILKRTFIDSMNNSLQNLDLAKCTPHDVVGKGGSKDILMEARHQITEVIVKIIKVIGSDNRV